MEIWGQLSVWDAETFSAFLGHYVENQVCLDIILQIVHEKKRKKGVILIAKWLKNGKYTKL